jgi:hypothetical protein
MKQLKRYTLSGDQRYNHNRDSAWNDNENLFVYEDKNGKWVKFDDVESLIDDLKEIIDIQAYKQWKL